ncbi:hypothetical protein [Vogesella oryzae]|uniref:hypothetical protein n=1 Tax=Vogesella oryzae TaxID=1735285 RepID=UPI0015828243|nr:hypothetical protein [Vogesella oryzae]
MEEVKKLDVSIGELHDRATATEAAVGLLIKQLGLQLGFNVEEIFVEARAEASALTPVSDFTCNIVRILDAIEDHALS